MKTVLKNAKLLLPNHTIREGWLALEDGLIAEIGQDEPPCSSEIIDLKGALVMPGLINCHGHTAMTLVRGLGGGLPLQRWLEEAIFPVEAKMTPADVEAGMRWGAMEMLAGGTTCVADMYDFPDVCERVLAEVGMKGHTSRVGLAFADNVPPNRLAECIDYARAGLLRRVAPRNDDSSCRHCERSEAIHLLQRDICVHSEYLTNETFCRALAEANQDLKRPLHVHVSETEKEHAECLARHGKTPMAYLADVGLLDYGAYAAHCVYCTDDDFRLMAEKGVTLVHNPTSNLKLGSGFARIPRALELGVNVALGTDGCASNDNLNLFEEMHLASLIHKGIARRAEVLSAWDMIDMATINGAKALGRNTGALEVGRCADLCVVDLQKPHLIPCLDLANLIVNSMQASDVVMTFVDGKVVYDGRDGQNWLNINHERAEFDFRSAVRRLNMV